MTTLPDSPVATTQRKSDPHTSHVSRLNSLRAAVLGANDGIVSIAALVVGVAGATDSAGTILMTGVAGVLAGALSMAAGEYVSVSSQRDTERVLIEIERGELIAEPERELEELTTLYEEKGLSRDTAEVVARELTAHDAFASHLDAELRIDPEKLANPWEASVVSALSFIAGSILPMLAITLPPPAWRIPATFVSVICALAITGAWSAHSGGASKVRATMRVVSGGILAMIVTFGIGKLFGASGI